MQENVELPSLTVVIPNYNYGHWIQDAINSVAIDKYPRKQIFVVDDGSTDGSWDIICKLINVNGNTLAENTAYQGSYINTPVFAFRFPQAGGPSRARNMAIQAMWNHTHLFGFLDADDVYLPGKITKSIQKFIEDPEHIGAIYTDYDTVDIDSGRRVRVYKEPFNRNKLLQNCIVHSACMVNKLALHQCGVYDDELRVCEDYDLWLRISERFVFVHIPEPLMLVRVGPHNSTSTVQQATWEKNYRRVFEKLAERQYGR